MPERNTKLKRAFFPENGKKLGGAAYAFLFLLCMAFFLPGIASLPPTDRDESLFAQATKQMVETGNYTDIRVQKEPRYKKPIGIYWLQSAAVEIFNSRHLDQIWAYRIPSFVGATVAVLMTAALGALLFSPQAGILAATMLASCVLLNVEARLAKTDAALLGCVVTAMWAMAHAYLGTATRWKIPLTFWTAIALGILIKGPVVLLPVFGVLIWTLNTEGSIAFFKRLRPAAGFLYAAALVAPWFVAISMQSHGEFMQQSAGNDMLAKIWQGQNRGILPPGLHLLAFPVLFFPSSLFAAFALPDAWKNRAIPAVRFLLGWIVPTWIAFEIPMTKLLHYTLPVYPALALIAAKFLLDGFPSISATNKRAFVVACVGIWLLIGAVFAFVFAALPTFTNKDVFILQVVAGGALMVAQAIALAAFFDKKALSVGIAAVASLFFLTTTIAYSLPRLNHIWLSRDAVKAANEISPCSKTQIVAFGYKEPSLVFSAGTHTIIAASAQEAADAMRQDRCRVGLVAAKKREEFLNAFGPQPPLEKRSIDALNAGRGKKMTLSLFAFPETP
ncbi:MAG: glycosyltransferase family 39 protein [Alphaproteobacteria bacterium]|nr:glycosyltransferase family 39 protein [Alphaproteobacteria bacterium]